MLRVCINQLFNHKKNNNSDKNKITKIQLYACELFLYYTAYIIIKRMSSQYRIYIQIMKKKQLKIINCAVPLNNK